jgi:hypothetical protein
VNTLQAVYERVAQDSASWSCELRVWCKSWNLNCATAEDWCYWWAQERFEEWAAVREGREVKPQYDNESVEALFERFRKTPGTAVTRAKAVPPKAMEDLRALYDRLGWDAESWPSGLRQWCKRWNLGGDMHWCYRWASDRVEEWTAAREGRQPRLTCTTATTPFLSGYSGAIEAFQPSKKDWVVYNEAETAFRVRAEEHFRKELNNYVERAKKAAIAAGWVRSPFKSERELEDHLTWLARFVIGGESPTDIWESMRGDSRGRPRGGKVTNELRSGRTYDAVRKAVHRAADFIGLILSQRQK